jgi:hypothetical protein
MKVLIAATCLFFLAFVATRAARVPLTYDEAASYIRYIDTAFPSVFDTNCFSIFTFEVATNHFLNTLLTKLCWVVAGGGELVIRMPNLIGYAIFMCFSLLILRRRARPVIAFAGFALLNLNPYVLEFFSLSRGYGLSLAFLMGAIFFLFRFLERLQTRDGACRDSSRALVFTCGAVLANFALLNVYLAVFGVVLVALAVSNSVTHASAAANPPGDGRKRAGSFPWLPLVAGVFSALVLSQDVGLSETLYKPVTVTLLGLNQTELDHARVLRTDIRGRDRPLAHGVGAPTWRSNTSADVRGLRVELPIADAARLAAIEVIVGSRSFTSDTGLSAWNSRDEGGTRIFEADASLSLRRSRMPEFRPLMNWAGDAWYAACLTAYTACALVILALLAVLLGAVGWLLVRANMLRVDQWRPLGSSALWVAALTGTPLYLLKRNAELYFGGNRSLIADTFYSTIERSFYGRTYHPTQTHIVFAGIVVTVVAFCVVLYVTYRRGKLSSMLPAACLLAIMVITSLSEVVQRFIFDTPYLTGRTALFYIPLYVLFVTLLYEAIAELGQAGKRIAISMLVAAVAFSAYHFTATANFTYASDWSADASTKLMMGDLRQVLAAERPPGSRVVLGVEQRHLPVAAYYAHMNTAAIIDVVPPSAPGIDFLYGDDKGGAARMRVIRRYPATGTVLARVGR